MALETLPLQPGNWASVSAYLALSGQSLRAVSPEQFGAVGNGVADDTAAWQACIDAAYAQGTDCVIRCGSPTYALNSTPRHDRSGNAILALPAARASVLLRMVIQGYPGGTQFTTTVTGQSYSGSFGCPSLIGGPTLEQTGIGVSVQFSGATMEFYDLQLQLGANPTIAGLDISGVSGVIMDRIRVNGSSSVQPTSIYSFGVRLPEGDNSGLVKVGYLNTQGVYAGVVANSAHLNADALNIHRCVLALGITGNTQFSGNDGHSSLIKYLDTEQCTHHLASWDPTVGVQSLPNAKPAQLHIDLFDIEDAVPAQWYTTVEHVLDANNQLNGEANYGRVLSNTGRQNGITASGATHFDLYDVNGSRELSRVQIYQRVSGVLAENMPVGATNSAVAGTSQQLVGSLFGLRGGDLVTGMVLRLAVAAAGTLPTTARFGLADSTGKMLVVSGNLNALANWPQGAVQFPFSAAFQIPSDGGYFACWVVNGTWGSTQPTMIKAGSTSAAFGAVTGALTPSIQIGAQTDLPGVGASLSSITTANGTVFYTGLY